MNRHQAFLFFCLSLILVLYPAFGKKTVVHPASKKEMKLLKVTDSKYQNEHGIHLKIKKTITLGMLGSQRESEGNVWLNKGQMRLEIHKPEESKIIAGKNFLWIESPAPKDFKGAKAQVIKASLKSKRAKAQGLIQLLTQGGVLKYFKVSGVQREKGSVRFFLQPESQSLEFKRAQILVDVKTKIISELKYWDQMDNETTYAFLSSKFKQKIKKSRFQYMPPANAEVISY